MKKISYFFTGLLLLSATVLLTSSVPISRASVPEKTVQQAASPVTTAEVAPAPAPDPKAQTLTYKQLKTIATQVKGSKLTFKEKLALKLFGKKIANKTSASKGFGGGTYSQIVALILCAFVGSLGIHRFYLGYTWQGIVQLLTLGGCGIWSLIDFIRIAMGDLQPKDSQYDVTL